MDFDGQPICYNRFIISFNNCFKCCYICANVVYLVEC